MLQELIHLYLVVRRGEWTFLMEIFKKRHADRIDEKGAVEGATAVGEEAVYRVVKKSQCC